MGYFISIGSVQPIYASKHHDRAMLLADDPEMMGSGCTRSVEPSNTRQDNAC